MKRRTLLQGLVAAVSVSAMPWRRSEPGVPPAPDIPCNNTEPPGTLCDPDDLVEIPRILADALGCRPDVKLHITPGSDLGLTRLVRLPTRHIGGLRDE